MSDSANNRPVWRSLRYVPVNVDRYVDKAHTRGADGVILALAERVPPAEKAHPRTPLSYTHPTLPPTA